ncbi:MAG: transposase, partial [Tindallia sp. MSAO_Bac2]
MARQMRKRSRTGIYHVMIRGNSGQTIFEYDE